MCVKGQRGWIFGSNNRARWCKDGKGKDSGSGRLAGVKECERYTEVFVVGKLSQMVCQKFCKDSKAIA